MTALTPRDTRQEIVFAATPLFIRQGYAATTMQRVAEELGISKGNLTYHFPSKQALFEAVAEVAGQYVHERILIRSFEEGPDTLTAVREFTRRLRRWFIDPDERFVGCIFTNVAIETQHTDPAIGLRMRNFLTGIKTMLAQRFADAQARGEIRADMSAYDLTNAFFWMYEGALALSRANNDPSEYDAFCAFMPVWLAPPEQ